MKLSVDGVYEALDNDAARSLLHAAKVRGVYAYEDGAEAVFRAAKTRGVSCLYDLPIGYWRFYHRLLAEERELQPDWSSTLDGMHDSREKLERKDAELALADVIVVASSFTARTLEELSRRDYRAGASHQLRHSACGRSSGSNAERRSTSDSLRGKHQSAQGDFLSDRGCTTLAGAVFAYIIGPSCCQAASDAGRSERK